ncbi:hypothetical protein J437_LFUL012674 [Ladona fulva]|uniref:EF-hand domain-containing protein n=1 Tax=Ladona fulva TaxID=123851 RepID=A0A8K0P4Z9_LADFU|nr:hypothetical protein J437_LFUL012674 [Ladona fulva]
MKTIVLSLLGILILKEVVAPPVTTKKGEEDENEIQDGPDWDLGVEYKRYLREVVQALESDPQFKEKLEKTDAADIRSGKIARELEFVSHHVRTKLDELKRQELERLRRLALQQHNEEELRRTGRHEEMEATGGEHEQNDIASHVDHKNPHYFEMEDLRKLIVQTTKVLDEADRKRKEEFKQYEMQKEFEKQELLRRTENEEQRKQLEKEFQEMEEKHKKHPQLHHPGSKQQLEEVWEEQDHMNPEDFNPKTFFHLHDLDGNGVWDADEVKTLFRKELDKMYDPNAPEDDVRERVEEMERMREHVFNESDTNQDKLISYDEFLAQTKKEEFKQDPGWEGLDKTPAYTHEEYEAFEHQRLEEVRRLVEQGLIPPQPVFHPPPMYNHPNAIPNHGYQVHPGQQQFQQGGHVPQQQHPMASNQVYHPPPSHGVPQYHPGQVQYHPVATNQHPPQGYQAQHAAYQQGQYAPNQGYQQPPQQVYHPNVQQYQQPPPPQQAYAQHAPASNQVRSNEHPPQHAPASNQIRSNDHPALNQENKQIPSQQVPHAQQQVQQPVVQQTASNQQQGHQAAQIHNNVESHNQESMKSGQHPVESNQPVQSNPNAQANDVASHVNEASSSQKPSGVHQ